MYEIEFLAIGEKTRSGDAIVMRFDRPDGSGVAHVVIDGGLQSNGPDVANHVANFYGTDSIDLVILSHPDGDHIGGLGHVLREFNVGALLAHDIGAHGFVGPAAEAVDELIDLANRRNIPLYQPFAGLQAFGGALLVAGPSETYYQALVNEQMVTEKAAPVPTLRLSEALARFRAKVLSRFPIETDFDDAGGVEARNNSSTVIDLRLGDARFLFTGDAGVPALNYALDFLDAQGRNDVFPKVVQVPHHGSRHNLDLSTINRITGPHYDTAFASAQVSISEAAAEDPRYPSPRIANALGRRGYRVVTTAGQTVRHKSPDAEPRRGWVPVTPLPPLDEEIDDR
jgi:beta-lactamase superfamily II metal-dependent hydrolase